MFDIIIYGTIGFFIGMWVRNQLNEDKDPRTSIKAAVVTSCKWCRGQVMYCFKKIPKTKKKVVHGND